MGIRDRLRAKNIEFKNRLVMSPMARAKADGQGHVTRELLEYYDKMTQGGYFGAVIVEHSYVDRLGMASQGQISVSQDSDIEGLAKLADLIKSNGSLAILQISHAGSLAKKSVIATSPLAPSALMSPTSRGQDLPLAMTGDQISLVESQFIKGARRARKAGFDGVEIHSAHGYLLNQFLSPLSNKRTDDYGGDIHSRIRIHKNIIGGIKASLGSDYPLFLRLGAGDFMPGGLSMEDAILAAKEFERLGLDVLDISGGMSFYTIKETRPGYFDLLSKPIFEAVNIPLILTGGVKKGSDVQDVLDRGVCDLVGVGRALLKDPNWLKREVACLREDRKKFFEEEVGYE